EELPTKLFVTATPVTYGSVAAVATQVFVEVRFVSGPASTLDEVDRDVRSHLLQAPSLFVRFDESARVYVGDRWRTALSIDRSGDIHEHCDIDNAYTAEVKCIRVDESSTRVEVRAYVVKN